MNEERTIKPILGDMALVLIFQNNSHNPPSVHCIVCEDMETRDREVNKIALMRHIEIIGSSAGRIAWRDDE